MGFFDDVGKTFKKAGSSIVQIANVDKNTLAKLQSVGDPVLSGLTVVGDSTLSGLKTAGNETLSGLKTAGVWTIQNIMGSKQQPQLMEGTEYVEEQSSTDYSGLLILGVVGVVVWRLLRR